MIIELTWSSDTSTTTPILGPARTTRTAVAAIRAVATNFYEREQVSKPVIWLIEIICIDD